MEIWDIPTTELANLKEIYEKFNGIILIFSLSDKSSFDNLKSWIESILPELNSSTPLVIARNKSDLHTNEINTEEIHKLCKEYNLKYFEVSAKDSKGIDELFNAVSKSRKPKIERLASMETKSKGKNRTQL